MNRVSLEAYKKQLAEMQNATQRILSQLEKEFSQPDRRATTRKVNVKRLLVESGFFNEEEAEGTQAKGLYTFIEEYSDQITEEQLKRTIQRVLRFQEEGKVKDKVPYLKMCIKNFIREKVNSYE